MLDQLYIVVMLIIHMHPSLICIYKLLPFKMKALDGSKRRKNNSHAHEESAGDERRGNAAGGAVLFLRARTYGLLVIDELLKRGGGEYVPSEPLTSGKVLASF